VPFPWASTRCQIRCRTWSAGTLRALAITDAKRSRRIPDVPTMGEAVPGYAIGGTIRLGTRDSATPLARGDIYGLALTAVQKFCTYVTCVTVPWSLRASLSVNLGGPRPPDPLAG
jgi:hypothetical protein